MISSLKSFKHKGMSCRTLEVINRAKKDSTKSRFDFCKVKDDSWKVIFKK